VIKMNDGLDILEEQFLKLNSKERDLIIFRNVTHNRKRLKDYSLHKKIQYVWLSILTVFVGVKKFIGV